jgi:hypothetical protein
MSAWISSLDELQASVISLLGLCGVEKSSRLIDREVQILHAKKGEIGVTESVSYQNVVLLRQPI